ncbi:MAG: hypothetical protein A2Z72_04440 [Omnitrophica bacterium RBG_13_46_9]|nr:MAG: hypothetical protein A2Z72_04440 [Omnitrophica bacterium RBG_13_46_9]
MVFRICRIFDKRLLQIPFYFIIVSVCAVALAMQDVPDSQLTESMPLPEVVLSQDDRVLVLAPHPDDEVLGCGGIIQKATAMKLPLRVVFFTYGDSNQWSFLVYRKRFVVMPKAVKAMGLVRHDEALAADRTLGVSKEKLIFLGYPDFSTLSIWQAHWGNSPPATSMLTHANAVPYANAFRPGAAYKGDEILKDLKTILREFKPTKIFISHPIDHHPDHRALYLFTRIALWDVEKEMQPDLYPYLVHYKHWPKPGGYRPDKPLNPPVLFEKKAKWQTSYLKPEEINYKHDAIKKHRSQFESSAVFLLPFIRRNELFGDFPVVKLKSDTSSVPLSPQRKDDVKELPDYLNEEERAAFVGIEDRFVLLEDGQLVFYIRLSRPIEERAEVSLSVFGYRDDKAFANMPKLDIKFSSFQHKILDQDRRLPMDAVMVERKPKEIVIRIPLALLKNPQRILTSAQSYMDSVPLDWVSWRIIELSD